MHLSPETTVASLVTAPCHRTYGVRTSRLARAMPVNAPSAHVLNKHQLTAPTLPRRGPAAVRLCRGSRCPRSPRPGLHSEQYSPLYSTMLAPAAAHSRCRICDKYAHTPLHSVTRSGPRRPLVPAVPGVPHPHPRPARCALRKRRGLRWAQGPGAPHRAARQPAAHYLLPQLCGPATPPAGIGSPGGRPAQPPRCPPHQ